MEKTLIIIKPDGVLRGKIGEVISRFENVGLKIVGAKMIRFSEKLARTHYSEHEGKPFFESLLNYVRMSPVLLMVVEGENAIEICRKLAGATNPSKALPGTIRGDFGISGEEIFNILHASDSAKAAEREIDLFFSDSEIFSYEKIWF
ncbi:MAG: nucleoside-diphosphate kinase [Candidatus Methanofastidiosia archaeon]